MFPRTVWKPFTTPLSRARTTQSPAAWPSGSSDTTGNFTKFQREAALDLIALHSSQGRVQQHLRDLAHGGEANILGQTVVVTIIDLLDDDRRVEESEHVVKNDV